MPTIGDIYAITIQSFMENQLGENVSHWAVSTAGASTDTQIATRFAAVFETAYLSWMSSAAILFGVTVQKIWPLPRLIYNQLLVNLPGTASDEALPPQASGLIETFNANAGGHNRGRIYVPFPARDWLDTVAKKGQVNTAGVALLNNIGAAYNATLVVAGGTVLQYGAYNRTSHVLTPLIFAEGKDLFATQKRRSYFGRANAFPI